MVGGNLSAVEEPVFRTPVRAKARSREQNYCADPEVYGFLLAKSPLGVEGSRYLTGRCISQKTQRAFGIAEIADSLALTKSLLHAFNYSRVEQCGLLANRSTKERPVLVFRSNQLVFPFFDGAACVYLQSRGIGPNPIRGNKYICLRGVHRPLYNANALAKEDKILICEGIMDVLSAAELGRPAVGVLGASTVLTKDQIEKFRSKTVLIVADNDAAGNRLGRRLREQLLSNGITQLIQRLPSGYKDINEYLVGSCRK